MVESWAVVDVAPPPDGMLTTVDVDGTFVALGRLDGSLVAFDETCTHRACPLSDGVLADGSITCPCHKSRFDLRTGTPINGPAVEPIRIRQVREDGGRVHIER
ncbi:MAG: putative Rieske Fe-S rane protein [Chloroflexi bacterium]|nr:putative Rieske Fe-S rane protein [Chloroflexota bacterium]